MRKRIDYKTLLETRARVVCALADLRKEYGYQARANFGCCISCGMSELREKAVKRGSPGIVFWHNQDDQGFHKDGILYLSFSAVGCDPSDWSHAEVAKNVIVALAKYGLWIRWDGNINKRIVVAADPSSIHDMDCI